MDIKEVKINILLSVSIPSFNVVPKVVPIFEEHHNNTKQHDKYPLKKLTLKDMIQMSYKK